LLNTPRGSTIKMYRAVEALIFNTLINALLTYSGPSIERERVVGKVTPGPSNFGGLSLVEYRKL